MKIFCGRGVLVAWLCLVGLALAIQPEAAATAAEQDGSGPESSGQETYGKLKRFTLDGGSAIAENLVLKRDRAEMTFSGTFYFESSTAGQVRGAVFIGDGTFRAEAPPSEYEREHVKRMLKADAVESTFRTAVLRFTDDTFEQLGLQPARAGGTSDAQKVAGEFEPRLLRETGMNVSSRLTLSLLNGESPGFFIAQFDGGRRSRFTYVFDQQGRVPSTTFNINGGEKGLLFAARGAGLGNDIWMAFYSLQDYERNRADYSDIFDLVEKPKYTILADLREPRRSIAVSSTIDLVSRVGGLRAIPFALSEGLPEYDQLRKKKGMRATRARMHGRDIPVLQEEWEDGFLILLPAPRRAGEAFQVEIDAEGSFIYDRSDTFDCHYPFINGRWYPRHGYLPRSKFDITFLHHRKYTVAGPGGRVTEERSKENPNEVRTVYHVEEPVALVTFGLGPFKRYQETRKLNQGPMPVEFYSLEGSRGLLTIKEDFILAEMGNALNYMGTFFGSYPYGVFRAVFHPFGFGQGFASLLAIPNADRTNKYTFSFLAHETAHQWWGNIVSWRSYRDQWLSEGFAEYSGILYTALRDKPGSARELRRELRDSLKDPPETEVGIGKGRLADVGPIILGHRLSTRETLGAYTTLIYNKGALVLRMLHFLFADPNTGEGNAFFEMMKDFVQQHQNDAATTESFAAVAGEHFSRSPLGRRYQLKDLNWFFRQWVYQAHLPSYRLEYQIENQGDGSVMVNGFLYQDNAPENWFMPIPVVFQFGRDQVARGVIHAAGPKTPVNIKLPMRPSKVDLDPDEWVLSEKTITRGR